MNWSGEGRAFFANVVGLGRVTAVDDSGTLQLLQVTEGAAGRGYADRVTDKVVRVVEFGFSSNPPLDSEIVILRRMGDRGQSFVIATSHRASRLKNLLPGDSAQYDVRGAYIWMTENGIEIETVGLPVTIHGDLHVTGDVVSRSAGTPVSLNAVRDAYVAHHHTGVSTGTGTSGPSDQISV